MFHLFRMASFVALVAFGQGFAQAGNAVPVPSGDLPATFEGTLPCANCMGIQTRITLFENQTYFMTQTYVGEPGPNVANDLGKWVPSQFGNVLVAKGQRGDIRYFRATSPNALDMLDIEGRTIFSDLNYTLKRAQQVDVLDLKLFPLNGMYQYLADAGRFTECVSGLEFPVLTDGDNAKLEQAYLEKRVEVGQALFASVYGRILPALNMEETRSELSLHPLRFESIGQSVCAPRLRAATLTEQPWALVQLNGKPVVLQESGRAPGLTFHADENRISGSGGCNQLVGSFTADSNSLQIGMLAATRMACFDNNIEGEFLQTLTQVKSWNILGQRLELYGQLGNLLARFETN